MQNLRTKLLLPILLSSFSLPTFAMDKTVVAKVNGKEVYAQELIMTAEQNKIDYKTLDNKQKSILLNGLINRILVATEAKKIKLDQGDDIKLRINALIDSVLAASMLEKLTKEAKFSDKEIKKYYNSKVLKTTQKQYKARHILAKQEADAKAIFKDLKAGKDFGALAQEKSMDKGTAITGGDLGWFNPATMVPSFAKAVKIATKGRVTGPVKSQFGWHLILVDDVKPIVPPSLEESKSNITQILTKEKLSAYLEGLKVQYKIENLLKK